MEEETPILRPVSKQGYMRDSLTRGGYRGIVEKRNIFETRNTSRLWRNSRVGAAENPVEPNIRVKDLVSRFESTKPSNIPKPVRPLKPVVDKTTASSVSSRIKSDVSLPQYKTLVRKPSKMSECSVANNRSSVAKEIRKSTELILRATVKVGPGFIPKAPVQISRESNISRTSSKQKLTSSESTRMSTLSSTSPRPRNSLKNEQVGICEEAICEKITKQPSRGSMNNSSKTKLEPTRSSTPVPAACKNIKNKVHSCTIREKISSRLSKNVAVVKKESKVANVTKCNGVGKCYVTAAFNAEQPLLYRPLETEEKREVRGGESSDQSDLPMKEIIAFDSGVENNDAESRNRFKMCASVMKPIESDRKYASKRSISCDEEKRLELRQLLQENVEGEINIEGYTPANLGTLEEVENSKNCRSSAQSEHSIMDHEDLEYLDKSLSKECESGEKTKNINRTTWRSKALRKKKADSSGTFLETKKLLEEQELFQNYAEMEDENLRQSIIRNESNIEAVANYFLVRNGNKATIRILKQINSIPHDTISGNPIATKDDDMTSQSFTLEENVLCCFVIHVAPPAQSAASIDFNSMQVMFQMAVTSPGIVLWQNLNEVVASGLLETLTKQQLSLQEALFEIISSQASYVKSLTVLEEYFMVKIKVRVPYVLKEKDFNDLFFHIKPLFAKERQLFEKMLLLCENDIMMTHLCDLVANHYNEAREMYLKYGRHQDSVLRHFRQMCEVKPNFDSLVKDLCNSNDAGFLPFDSYLNLPMQRATKMPLLLKTVIAQAERNSETFNRYADTLAAVERVAEDLNEEAGKMRQWEEMLKLDRELDMPDALIRLPLIQNSRNIVLRSWCRKIEGRKSKIKLILFNDLFVIAKKTNAQGSKPLQVCDYAQRCSLSMKPKSQSSSDEQTPMDLQFKSDMHKRQMNIVIIFEKASDNIRWLNALSSAKEAENWEQKVHKTHSQVVITKQHEKKLSDELGLNVGDFVTVLFHKNDGWSFGEKLVDGSRGWFRISNSQAINSLSDQQYIQETREKLRKSLRREEISLNIEDPAIHESHA